MKLKQYFKLGGQKLGHMRLLEMNGGEKWFKDDRAAVISITNPTEKHT